MQRSILFGRSFGKQGSCFERSCVGPRYSLPIGHVLQRIVRHVIRGMVFTIGSFLLVVSLVAPHPAASSGPPNPAADQRALASAVQ